MELHERFVQILRNVELWQDMDGIGTLDTYGLSDADYTKIADAAIAAVLDAMGEPSEGMRLVGEAEIKARHPNLDSFNDPYVDSAWKAMLAAFRAEALGESTDRDTITP